MHDNIVNIVAYHLWEIQSVPGSVSRDKGCSAGGIGQFKLWPKKKGKTNYEKRKGFFLWAFNILACPDPQIGHVGAPLPCNLIKLVDVPEKNYFASKGEGEVSHMAVKQRNTLYM